MQGNVREQNDHLGHIQKSVIYWYYLLIGMQRQQGQGYVIIPKKKQNKEETGDHKKKGKKNKKEEWELQDARQFQKMESYIPEKKIEPPGNYISEEEKDRMLMEMCEILPQHSPKDILKCLRKYRYDMQETINHMADQPEKAEQKSEKAEIPQTKNDKTEMAHNLLSQVCDQLKKENISGEEFQQIFDEIAEMFREKEQEPQQVNSFVDQCSSMKAALLIAFKEELANYDDFQFDMESPLWFQTQTFKLQAKEKRYKADKDFPALADHPPEIKEESPFYKNLKQEKKKQQQLVLFAPPKNNMPQFSQKKPNNSIFNLDNKHQTQASLSDLHKRFGNIPIPWLKFVYQQLGGNFNQCCEFFWKYYKEMCEERVIPVRRSEPSQPPPRPRVMSNVASMNAVRKEEVDEDVRHMTLREIRNELDYLYKLRQTIQIMKGKVKSGNQRLDLQRMINQKNPRINKLSRAARIREIQRMTEGNPLFIDLHGYRQQQIPPLFDSIAQMLKQNKWSERVKARKIDGTLTATFVAMTGKGLHSWGNRSVLKPAVQSWGARNGCQSFEESDGIRLSIPLQ